MDAQSRSPLYHALKEDARADRQAWAIAVVILVGFFIVDSLSIITEIERAGKPLRPALPWIYEGSSALMLALILPAVALVTRRIPLTAETWKTALPLYLAAAAIYSAVHIAGMVAIRKAMFFLLWGEQYLFFDERRRVVAEIIYEFRKDLLSFCVFSGLFLLWRNLLQARREADVARREAAETSRLTLKCGGKTMFLDAASIDFAKAAGNYVEIAAGGKTHLARITMAALEEQLAGAGAPIVRAHRSWLVNKSKIAEIVPAGDGDVTIRMKSGAEAPGSRRYRERLGG